MLGAARDGYVPRQPYQLGLPGIACTVLPATPRLAASVHYYWTLAIARGPVVLPVVPDNAADLVLCPAAPEFAELYFPVERRFDLRLEGPARYVGVCLRLERLEATLGARMAELRALAPGLETRERLGLEPLTERLARPGAGTGGLAARLDAFFGARHSRGGARVDARAALFSRFVDAFEGEPVAATARRAGLSERQLRRETHRLFGLGPKRLQRVVRLQRALAELIDGTPPRADFADDAHRIRELRALTGWTPGEIRRMAETYNAGRARSATLRVPSLPSETRR